MRLSCVKAEEVNATNTLITTTSIQRQGLTTKTSRAKRFVDCVTLPGFYLKTTSPATQEVCVDVCGCSFENVCVCSMLR